MENKFNSNSSNIINNKESLIQNKGDESNQNEPNEDENSEQPDDTFEKKLHNKQIANYIDSQIKTLESMIKENFNNLKALYKAKSSEIIKTLNTLEEKIRVVLASKYSPTPKNSMALLNESGSQVNGLPSLFQNINLNQLKSEIKEIE